MYIPFTNPLNVFATFQNFERFNWYIMINGTFVSWMNNCLHRDVLVSNIKSLLLEHCLFLLVWDLKCILFYSAELLAYLY